VPFTLSPDCRATRSTTRRPPSASVWPIAKTQSSAPPPAISTNPQYRVPSTKGSDRRPVSAPARLAPRRRARAGRDHQAIRGAPTAGRSQQILRARRPRARRPRARPGHPRPRVPGSAARLRRRTRPRAAGRRAALTGAPSRQTPPSAGRLPRQGSRNSRTRHGSGR
jgi:hypothetical protein